MDDTRHAWSFSLRTLFVLVTILGVGLGWLFMQIHRAEQREAMRDLIRRRSGYANSVRAVTSAMLHGDLAPHNWKTIQYGDQDSSGASYPGALFDSPTWGILVPKGEFDDCEVSRIRELFPEAWIEEFWKSKGARTKNDVSGRLLQPPDDTVPY